MSPAQESEGLCRAHPAALARLRRAGRRTDMPPAASRLDLRYAFVAFVAFVFVAFLCAICVHLRLNF
jgi:hypothetical protein